MWYITLSKKESSILIFGKSETVTVGNGDSDKQPLNYIILLS